MRILKEFNIMMNICVILFMLFVAIFQTGKAEDVHNMVANSKIYKMRGLAVIV